MTITELRVILNEYHQQKNKVLTILEDLQQARGRIQGVALANDGEISEELARDDEKLIECIRLVEKEL